MDSQEKTLEMSEQQAEVKQNETVVEPAAEEVKQEVTIEETATEEVKQEETVVEPATEEVKPEEATVEAIAETVAEETKPEVEAVTETAEEVKKASYDSKQEILERLKEIAQSDATPEKSEVEQLKTIFYKLHFAEREAQMKEYLDNGGDPEKYQILPDEEENTFKAEMTIIREKRQKAFAEQEQEKQENLKTKLNIIEKIKAMVTSPDKSCTGREGQ